MPVFTIAQEMVEYFKELIYYVAMVPDGELNSEDAEDMLRCKAFSQYHPHRYLGSHLLP